MTYVFKLQAVLDHRRYIEDNLKRERAAIRQLLNTAEEQLTMLIRKETNTRETLAYEQERGLASDGVVAYLAYLKRLGVQIDTQRAEIASITERLVKKQDEIVEANKNRQILEKLRDKDVERFNLAMRKKENAFIDEIAVNRFARTSLTHRGEEK